MPPKVQGRISRRFWGINKIVITKMKHLTVFKIALDTHWLDHNIIFWTRLVAQVGLTISWWGGVGGLGWCPPGTLRQAIYQVCHWGKALKLEPRRHQRREILGIANLDKRNPCMWYSGFWASSNHKYDTELPHFIGSKWVKKVTGTR